MTAFFYFWVRSFANMLSCHFKLPLMPEKYIVPAGVRIDHVHLKVTDLQRSIRFYCDLLGFEITTMYGSDAAFLSAGGYHHHIGLNTWYSINGVPSPLTSAGLFHTAIRYPERRQLAEMYSGLSSVRM